MSHVERIPLSLPQLQDKATVLTTERKKVSPPRVRGGSWPGGGGWPLRRRGDGRVLHSLPLFLGGFFFLSEREDCA